MRLLRLLVAAALLWPALALAQNAIPYFTGQPYGPGGGFDPSSPMNNFNILIGELNGILNPLAPQGTVPFTVNTSTGQGAGNYPMAEIVAGTPAQQAAGTNVNLGLDASGNGNIEFFADNQVSELGLVQFGNTVSWLPAKGLAACPGNPSTLAQNSGLYIGPSPVVTGYISILDWAGRPHWLVGCG